MMSRRGRLCDKIVCNNFTCTKIHNHNEGTRGLCPTENEGYKCMRQSECPRLHVMHRSSWKGFYCLFSHPHSYSKKDFDWLLQHNLPDYDAELLQQLHIVLGNNPRVSVKPTPSRKGVVVTVKTAEKPTPEQEGYLSNAIDLFDSTRIILEQREYATKWKASQIRKRLLKFRSDNKLEKMIYVAVAPRSEDCSLKVICIYKTNLQDISKRNLLEILEDKELTEGVLNKSCYLFKRYIAALIEQEQLYGINKPIDIAERIIGVMDITISSRKLPLREGRFEACCRRTVATQSERHFIIRVEHNSIWLVGPERQLDVLYTQIDKLSETQKIIEIPAHALPSRKSAKKLGNLWKLPTTVRASYENKISCLKLCSYLEDDLEKAYDIVTKYVKSSLRKQEQHTIPSSLGKQEKWHSIPVTQEAWLWSREYLLETFDLNQFRLTNNSGYLICTSEVITMECIFIVSSLGFIESNSDRCISLPDGRLFGQKK